MLNFGIEFRKNQLLNEKDKWMENGKCFITFVIQISIKYDKWIAFESKFILLNVGHRPI